jgi:hypothetical protein
MSTDTAPGTTNVRDDVAQRVVEPRRVTQREPEPSRPEAVTEPSSTGWRIPLAVLIGGCSCPSSTSAS